MPNKASIQALLSGLQSRDPRAYDALRQMSDEISSLSRIGKLLFLIGFNGFLPRSIIFGGPGGILSEDENHLVWDFINLKLGVKNVAPASTLDVGGSFQCDSINNDTGLAHGTYTPALTNVGNVAASTPLVFQYMRVGNTVTCSGQVQVDPTTTLLQTDLGISLPINSDFNAETQCIGIGAYNNIVGENPAAIIADAANDRANMRWFPTDVTAQYVSVHFTFLVR